MIAPCSVCGEDSIVAVGHDRTPLCLDHFAAYLGATRRSIMAARERLIADYGETDDAEADA